MSFKASKRLEQVKPSPTLAITALAAELRASGKDVIGLGAGEPDFATPQHIKDAAKAAIDDNFTKYTAVDGIPSLKQAIIDKYKRDNQLEYTPQQVLVSSGGKQSFYNLIQAVVNPGDEVIIPAPYWVSYPDMVLLAEGKPVIIPGDQQQRFKITAAQLEAAISDKTKLVILNSPSNPAGTAYTKAELEALGEVLRQHPQVLIATDDMYELILWADEPFCNIVMACPDLYPRSIVFNGVSKCYAMTGWRIGYAAGDANIIKAMKTIQSQSTSNPCSVSQKAAEAALNGDQSCVTEMNVAFKRRHDMVLEGLNQIKGFECIGGDGTFYLFPNVEQAIANTAGINNDAELCSYIIEKAEVALVPGSAFGLDGHLRLSFATSDEALTTALRRIKDLLGAK